MDKKLEKALGDARRQLDRLYGYRLRQVVLFGSQARGEARPDSDVDVLVVLEGPLHRYDELKKLVDLSLLLFNRHGYWLSFKLLPGEDFQAPDHPLMLKIREEGVVL